MVVEYSQHQQFSILIALPRDKIENLLSSFPSSRGSAAAATSKCPVFASLYENVKIIECLRVGLGAPVTDLLSPHNLDTDTT